MLDDLEGEGAEEDPQRRVLRVDDLQQRRLGTDPETAEDPRARALVASALACADAATNAWIACDGKTPFAVLIDRAMDALTA